MTQHLEPTSEKVVWTGRVLSGLAVLVLATSAVMKFVKPADFDEGMQHIGWATTKANGLAVLELACTALYLVPRTSVLGAILITGYLGGAIATHVRVDDEVLVQPLLGVLVWLGLWLRERRLREVLPLT
ncbi:MAG: DoxX family protein [Planctomycetes bacterium]|nr:DoxX family protein [Planctomycetota bacterium]